MKVVFLDIDGVLNSDNRGEELHAKMEAGEISKDEYYNNWDLPYEKTLRPLQRIIQTTGAIIVLSSSWRHGRVKQLNEVFGPYGFQIADTTCVGVFLSDLAQMGFDVELCYSVYVHPEGRKTSDRGAEIAEWLSRHPDVESFVILDDDKADIDQYYKNNHVWTDFYNWGLTEEKADQAIKVLTSSDNLL